MGNLTKNDDLPIEAKGIPDIGKRIGSWKDTGISISVYSFVPIDIGGFHLYLSEFQ